MLSIEDCKTLRTFLKENNIEELEKFVDKNYEKLYKDEAVVALATYNSRHFPPCRYSLLHDNQLLLSNGYCFVRLNSQDIYNEYMKHRYEQFKPTNVDTERAYLELLKNDPYSYSEFTSKEPEGSKFRIKSETDTIGKCFLGEVLDFANILLGIDATYTLRDNSEKMGVIKGESPKGRAYIYDINRGKYPKSIV